MWTLRTQRGLKHVHGALLSRCGRMSFEPVVLMANAIGRSDDNFANRPPPVKRSLFLPILSCALDIISKPAQGVAGHQHNAPGINVAARLGCTLVVKLSLPRLLEVGPSLSPQ